MHLFVAECGPPMEGRFLLSFEFKLCLCSSVQKNNNPILLCCWEQPQFLFTAKNAKLLVNRAERNSKSTMGVI